MIINSKILNSVYTFIANLIIVTKILENKKKITNISKSCSFNPFKAFISEKKMKISLILHNSKEKNIGSSSWNKKGFTVQSWYVTIFFNVF